MKYKSFIFVLIPVVIWLLAEAFLIRPRIFYFILSLCLLLIVLSIKYINNKHKEYWLLFTIFPILFLLSFFFYAAIVVSNFWIQSIFLLVIVFIFLYLRDFYYYSIQLEHSQAELKWLTKLDNLLISGSFLIAFASAAVLFRLSAFITWPIYIMLPIWAIIVWLLFVQFKPLKVPGSWSVSGLALINTLIITELAGILVLLPLNFNILALFLAIIYYLGLMIMRLAESDSLSSRALKLPLILSSIAILFLFLTARWL